VNDGPVGAIVYYVSLAIYEPSGNEPTLTVDFTVLRHHGSASGLEYILGIFSPMRFRREPVCGETCIMNPADKAAKKNSSITKKWWTSQFVEGAFPFSRCEVSRALAPDLRATPNRLKMILKCYPVDDVCGGICSVTRKMPVYNAFAPTAGCDGLVIGDRLAASTKQKCQKILRQ